jgi:hypothetical protein
MVGGVLVILPKSTKIDEEISNPTQEKNKARKKQKNTDRSVTHMRPGVDHFHVLPMPGSVPSPAGLAAMIIPSPHIITTPPPPLLPFSVYDARTWPQNHYVPASTGTPRDNMGQTLGSILVTWDYGGAPPGISFQPPPTAAQILVMQNAGLSPNLFLNNEVCRYQRGP